MPKDEVSDEPQPNHANDNISEPSTNVSMGLIPFPPPKIRIFLPGVGFQPT